MRNADSDVQFLHGMLEGMANIEARAYSLLRELGAAPLTKVLTIQLAAYKHLHRNTQSQKTVTVSES